MERSSAVSVAQGRGTGQPALAAASPHPQGLLRLLAALLARGSPQLLLLATTFLRRLSLYAENCAALEELSVVPQLVALVAPTAAAAPGAPGARASSGGGGVVDGSGVRGQLSLAVLRLLHNLSFSEGLRAQMVAAGLIARATALLQADLSASSASGNGGGGGGGGAEGPPLRALVLGLLYHLSLQDRHRSMFLYTGAPGRGGPCGWGGHCSGACPKHAGCPQQLLQRSPGQQGPEVASLAHLSWRVSTRADAIPTLHDLLLAAPAPLAATAPELAALLISLAGSTRVAEELSRCGRLEQLLARAVGPAEPAPVAAQPAGSSAAGGDPGAPSTAGGPGAGDELLWRLLRTLAGHDSEPLRARFAPALERVARLLVVRCGLLGCRILHAVRLGASSAG